MSLTLYFFLYPAGHFGFVAVTFLVTLSLMHVIVDFLIFCTVVIAEGLGEGDAVEGVIGSAFAA